MHYSIHITVSVNLSLYFDLLDRCCTSHSRIFHFNDSGRHCGWRNREVPKETNDHPQVAAEVASYGARLIWNRTHRDRIGVRLEGDCTAMADDSVLGTVYSVQMIHEDSDDSLKVVTEEIMILFIFTSLFKMICQRCKCCNGRQYHTLDNKILETFNPLYI